MDRTLAQRFLTVKRTLFDSYYSFLNPQQRQAVYTVKGPLLILAGAGSGKTTVLVNRIAYIIRFGNAYYSDFIPEGLTEERVARLEAMAGRPREEIEPYLDTFTTDACAPWRVLAITFTNKAAGEMKERLAQNLKNEELSGQVWAGTFHSICMRILRTHTEAAGLKPNFSIYDAEDSKKAISRAIRNLDMDEKVIPSKLVQSVISRSKDQLKGAEEYAQDVAHFDFQSRQIARIFKEYERILAEANALDFDDIILRTVKLFGNEPAILQQYQNRFSYVCVDEYQDTNKAQFVLTVQLSGGYNNLMVVGDDDQSIYRFRGATIENILTFDRVFRDATVIRLEENYRSTSCILQAANEVIRHNRGRHEKTLWTRRGDGEKITLLEPATQDEEGAMILDVILAGVRSGQYRYSDFAVLYRLNAQSNSLEKAFNRSGVPYRLLGGVRFADRKEIRDIVAYLQLIQNHDDTERMMRIINEPKRKIGEKAISLVRQIAVEEDLTMFTVMKNASRYVALAGVAKPLQAFADMIEELGEYAAGHSVLDTVNKTLNRTGYLEMLQAGGPDEQDRIDNLEEFKSNVVEYEENAEDATLAGFLEEVALVAEVDRYDATADAVVLMTIHSAKGLEFPVVFLPGMEENLFPSSRAVDEGPEGLEEERRLAYVAITRAKDRLYLLHARERLLYGHTSYEQVSRFVREIPQELIASAVRRKDPPPNYAGRGFYGSGTARSTGAGAGFGTPWTGSSKPRAAGGSTDPAELRIGDRVRHATFGEGEVLSVTRTGKDYFLEVAFDKAGTKRLLAAYAKLKKL